MYKKLKIKIAIDAYEELKKLLEYHSEYDCISLCPSEKSCCKSSKVEILLDNSREDYMADYVDELKIQYPATLQFTYKEITVVLSKDSFYLKAVPSNDIIISFKGQNNNCSGCKKSKKPGI